MFEKTLVKGAQNILALLGTSGILNEAYLAGGTALALQLGHRISVDFDFFSSEKFEPRIFADQLSEVGDFQETQASKGTVLGTFQGIRFSLFIYPHRLLQPIEKYLSVNIASIEDIAAMKIEAIAGRGIKRDFIDLYHICKSGYRMSRLFDLYKDKYKTSDSKFIHIQKSLIYFDDAEIDVIPKMLVKTNWEEVKSYFRGEVKKIMR